MLMRLFFLVFPNSIKNPCRIPWLYSLTVPLLRQLEHDVRNLDILLRLVLGGDFEDDVLLVGRDGLLADGLDEGGHPVGELC